MEEEILNKLRSVYTKITPKNIKNIKKKIRKEEKMKKLWFLMTPIAIACALVLFINFKQDMSIVSIDVNPSIELVINEKEIIKDVKVNNEDGNKILSNIKLNNVDLNTGINAIIASMLKEGYIDELKNSILITVENKDLSKGQQ